MPEATLTIFSSGHDMALSLKQKIGFYQMENNPGGSRVGLQMTVGKDIADKKYGLKIEAL
jgi:hypothetical protein